MIMFAMSPTRLVAVLRIERQLEAHGGEWAKASHARQRGRDLERNEDSPGPWDSASFRDEDEEDEDEDEDDKDEDEDDKDEDEDDKDDKDDKDEDEDDKDVDEDDGDDDDDDDNSEKEEEDEDKVARLQRDRTLFPQGRDYVFQDRLLITALKIKVWWHKTKIVGS